MSTPDSLDKVEQFYRGQLTSDGWKIIHETSNSSAPNKLANPVHLGLTARKDTREATVMIMDPMPTVAITVEVKQR